MKLSINILTLNNVDTLIDTLHVIKEEPIDKETEVIIVDNGSTDGCEDLATICNEKNLGISIGKNQGIRASKGEYILLLDGDVVPVKNSIRKLLEYMEANPECKALGFFPTKFSAEKNRVGMSYHESICHTLFNPRPSRTACLYYGIYHRSIFDVCMLDETGEYNGPGYGWEDHDFFRQMKEAGMTQWVCGMNYETGKYYHKINSSIRVMGHNQYVKSSEARGRQYHEKWSKVNV